MHILQVATGPGFNSISPANGSRYIKHTMIKPYLLAGLQKYGQFHRPATLAGITGNAEIVNKIIISLASLILRVILSLLLLFVNRTYIRPVI